MQENNENTAKQIELVSFNPITIIMDVLKRWYVIVLAAIFAGMVAYIATDQLYVPTYSTSTTFVVSAQGNSTTVYQNLSATTTLASVFSELLNSSLMRNAIMEELGMTSFDGTIEASAISSTNLLTLKVTASDPRTAFLVTKAIIENHQVVSYHVMGDTILEVLQEPKVPMGPNNFSSAGSYMKQAQRLAAIAMTVLLAVLSYMHDTVRSKQEAEKKLDCRTLVDIRHERKYKTLWTWIRRRKTGILITDPSTGFLYIETIRKLRLRVEQRMPEGGNVLMVTSILENEGKSTVAVNLALTMARKYKRVLLIDCDLRKPACYKILKYPMKGVGTKDVATGKAELEDTVVKLKGSGLYALLERKSVRKSMDIASSNGMAKLIQSAREQFDFIIIDTPPLTVTPDAECIGDLVDASILVVRQNMATANVINHAVASLSGSRSKMLGCVLNNVYELAISNGGSYRYGYGYGSYGNYSKVHNQETAKKSDG